MKKIVFALSFVSFIQLNAQPIIENANLLPNSSYNYNVRVNQGFSSPITLNSDVIWDFTSLTSISPGAISIIDAPASIYGSYFSSANYAYLIANMYSYFEVNSTEMVELAHTITNMGSIYDFNANGKKILQFPFNYGGTFTDDFISNSTTYSVDVAYAAYGTLNLPNGYSYDNVALITETSDLTTIYRWYTMNPFMSVAIYRESDHVFVWIEQDMNLGLDEKSALNVSIFPNPMEDKITFQVATETVIDVIEIYSSEGKLIESIQPNFVEGRMTINTDKFENGTYLVKVGNETFQLVK